MTTTASSPTPPSIDRTNLLPDYFVVNALGDKIKALEAATTRNRFLPKEHFCIRLDGVAFHTLTKGFQKPFDERFLDAMMFTARDMLEKFSGATLAYVESDEITLLFPAVSGDEVENLLLNGTVPPPREQQQQGSTDGQPAENAATETTTTTSGGRGRNPTKRDAGASNHLYDGRHFKILSTTAGYASARFNHHLSEIVTRSQRTDAATSDSAHDDHKGSSLPQSNHPPPLTGEKLRLALSHTSTFDSRAFSVPDLPTLTECVYWRSAHDCVRNAINGLAQATLDKKSLNRVSLVKVMKRLAEEEGIDVLTAIPPRALFGAFVKRERYELPPEACVNPVTGRHVDGPVYRTRIKCAALNWGDWSPEERTRFAVERFWPPGGVRGEYEIKKNDWSQ